MTKNDTNKGEYKSEGKYTKPYPPLHLITLQLHFSVRKMQGWSLVYLPSLLYPPLFVSSLFFSCLCTCLVMFFNLFNILRCEHYIKQVKPQSHNLKEYSQLSNCSCKPKHVNMARTGSLYSRPYSTGFNQPRFQCSRASF